jgi:hypothetical protein
MHTVVFYTNGLSIVSTVLNCHFSKQKQAVMITAKYNCYNIWLCGLIVWWTAQEPLQQPADRDSTDRAGSYDGNDNLVSAPRPPPTTINTIKAPHMPVRNL